MAGSPRSRKHGSLQVPSRAMEPEAIRRDAFPLARSRLGAASTAYHPSCVQANPSRQGPSSRIQGQARLCGNLRVLNSYWINNDATFKYFEVICIDPSHKAITRDPRINWISAPTHKHREMRGLTSAGQSNRGMAKGHGYNKRRPSMRATWKRQQQLSLRRYR